MKRNNRNIVFFILAASLLLCFTSCKKDKETEMVTLKLALEQPTDPSNQKVYLDDQRLVCWYTDDEIKIHNGSSTSTSQVLNQTATVAQGTNYTAVYPAANSLGTVNTVSNGSVTVTIPAVQTYVEGADGRQNLKDLPMGAYLTSSDAGNVPVLMFRNLASIIKVTVTNPNATYTFRVNSIKLSSSAANLHGTYTYSFNNRSSNKTVPTVTSSTSPTYGKEIMLDFNHTWTTIAGGSSKDFYLVVAPVSTASSFTIDVRGAVVGEAQISGGENVGNNYTEAIKVYSKTLTDANGGSASKKLARSIIGKVSANLSGFNVHGGFHVSSSKDSYFSHGNLSVGYNNGNGVYAFCVQGDGEQYHCMHSMNNLTIRNTSIANRSGVFLDLFNKLESNTVNNNKTYNYFPNQSNVNQFPAVSTYFPYANALVYADKTGVWRVPTESEWNYILGISSRSASYGHFAKAKITDEAGNLLKNGVILFPDVYTQPDGITINNIDNGTASFNGNSISHVKWKLMEAAGAIFLPTTGRVMIINGSYNCYFDGQDDILGFYWGLGSYSGLDANNNFTRAHSRLVFNNSNLQIRNNMEITNYNNPPVIVPNNISWYWIDNNNEEQVDPYNHTFTQRIIIAIRPIRD